MLNTTNLVVDSKGRIKRKADSFLVEPEVIGFLTIEGRFHEWTDDDGEDRPGITANELKEIAELAEKWTEAVAIKYSPERTALTAQNLAHLGDCLNWHLCSMGGEDGTDLFATTIAICNDDEEHVGMPLIEIIKANKEYFVSTPYDAQATAGQLRAMADLLDTYTHGALTCPGCDELYNPNIGCSCVPWIST